MKKAFRRAAENVLAGFKDDIVKCWSRLIFTAFASHQAKCLPKQITVEYTLRLRLYEMEQRLDSNFLSEYQTRILSI